VCSVSDIQRYPQTNCIPAAACMFQTGQGLLYFLSHLVLVFNFHMILCPLAHGGHFQYDVMAKGGKGLHERISSTHGPLRHNLWTPAFCRHPVEKHWCQVLGIFNMVFMFLTEILISVLNERYYVYSNRELSKYYQIK
jgi:hypothetical protein